MGQMGQMDREDRQDRQYRQDRQDRYGTLDRQNSMASQGKVQHSMAQYRMDSFDTIDSVGRQVDRLDR